MNARFAEMYDSFAAEISGWSCRVGVIGLVCRDIGPIDIGLVCGEVRAQGRALCACAG